MAYLVNLKSAVAGRVNFGIDVRRGHHDVVRLQASMSMGMSMSIGIGIGIGPALVVRASLL